jgi:protein gp37
MLNKQGPGKIDWTDYTWNPVTGCKHGCEYCYVKRLGDRFNYSMEPEFHPDRLGAVAKLKKPSKIFVSSTGDLFGDWVPEEWIYEVLKVADHFPEHTFQFLTKNPKRYHYFYFTPNCWLGTTINTYKDRDRVMDLLRCSENYKSPIKFVSIEPLLDDSLSSYFPLVDWVIVGGNSNAGAEKPKDWWLDDIMDNARALGIPVWVKDNYKYHSIIKEFPKRKDGVNK